jgi:hypothetical protein
VLRPEQFAGAMPAVWSEDDTVVYEVPVRSPAIAHRVRREAIPKDAGFESLQRYVHALDGETEPFLTVHWQGRNYLQIRGRLAAGEAVSTQVNYHVNWRAERDGKQVELRRDGLGMMWFEPGSAGECHVNLEFGAGGETWVARLAALLAVLAGLVVFKKG